MNFEVVIVNAQPSDADRLVGRTFVATRMNPPRVFLDDGTMLLVKDVKRDEAGRPIRYELELPPLDPSVN